MLEAKGWLSLRVSIKPESGNHSSKASPLISIPKKIVRLATQRNRIKRLIREAFRKEVLIDQKKLYGFRVMRKPRDPGLKEVQEIIAKLLGQ